MCFFSRFFFYTDGCSIGKFELALRLATVKVGHSVIDLCYVFVSVTRFHPSSFISAYTHTKGSKGLLNYWTRSTLQNQCLTMHGYLSLYPSWPVFLSKRPARLDWKSHYFVVFTHCREQGGNTPPTSRPHQFPPPSPPPLPTKSYCKRFVLQPLESIRPMAT